MLYEELSPAHRWGGTYSGPAGALEPWSGAGELILEEHTTVRVCRQREEYQGVPSGIQEGASVRHSST